MSVRYAWGVMERERVECAVSVGGWNQGFFKAAFHGDGVVGGSGGSRRPSLYGREDSVSVVTKARPVRTGVWLGAPGVMVEIWVAGHHA